MGRKKRKKRGFPVGVLVGFDHQTIHIWKIFSESVKKYKAIPLKRKWKNATEKDYYHYFEDLVNILRPIIDEGLCSILLLVPKSEKWAEAFLSHIEKHYHWLLNSRGNKRAFFSQIIGNAKTSNSIWYLLEKEKNKKHLENLIAQEGYFLIKQLEKTINMQNPSFQVFYGLEEVENRVYKGGKKDDSVSDDIDYLLLTDTFLENHPQKNRIYRLKQIAKNKGILTKVIPEECSAGERISQFGGLLCFKAVKY
ncbi:MAG: hypothetical protein GF311_17285 [Candidatus Lokiarchaeota archaeon]|nr:hypothetical protein [Candidatus Lokiarchaeota archaeon]